MLFKSGLTGEARGSMGGITAARNRYGLYFRQRVTPVNPNSTRQQVVRAVWMFLANQWTDVLTQLQRDAWDLYGENVIFKNKLGDDIQLTGYSHYQRSNGAIAAAGGALVQNGPTLFSLPGADDTFAAAISEATQLISVTFDNTLAWANEDEAFMLIHMALPRNGSRTFIGGPTRTAGNIDGDAITPPVSPADIAVPYLVAETQKTEVLARIIRADGRTSQLFRTTSIVAA